MGLDEFDRIEDEDLAIIAHEESNEFIQNIKANRKKSAEAIKLFVKNMGTEAKLTGQASKILAKFIATGRVTEEEEKGLKLAVYDLFKIAGIGIPFVIIPGASVLLPFIITICRKYGISILPSSFDQPKDEKE